MTAMTLDADAAVMMRTSNWIVESTAQLTNDSGELDLVIQSLACGLSADFGQSELEELVDLEAGRLRPEAMSLAGPLSRIG